MPVGNIIITVPNLYKLDVNIQESKSSFMQNSQISWIWTSACFIFCIISTQLCLENSILLKTSGAQCIDANMHVASIFICCVCHCKSVDLFGDCGEVDIWMYMYQYVPVCTSQNKRSIREIWNDTLVKWNFLNMTCWRSLR